MHVTLNETLNWKMISEKGSNCYVKFSKRSQKFRMVAKCRFLILEVFKFQS